MECTVCKRKTNHTTEEHRCQRCDGTGHSAKDHCGECRALGHSRKDHCLRCRGLDHKEEDHCYFFGCKLYTVHIHPCKYCELDHTTERHECGKCAQKGHDWKDHDLKAYCIACKVHGHTPQDTHIDCSYCKNRLINVEHLWCEHCSSCMFKDRPHVGVCEFCKGCLAEEKAVQGYDYMPVMRCIKCYKAPGDPDKYDLSRGVVHGYY